MRSIAGVAATPSCTWARCSVNGSLSAGRTCPPSCPKPDDCSTTDGLHQPFHLPDGKEAAHHRVAGGGAGLAFEERYVVRAHHAAIAGLAMRAHRGEHVGLAVVVERLAEVGRIADRVAEVDEVDARGEAADRGGD